MQYSPDELATPKGTIRLLKKFNFKMRKSLGQHFLIDRNILEKITKTADLKKSDVVLEIGAGLGTLTVALAKEAGFVIAVEYDQALLPILEEACRGQKGIRLLMGDALAMDFSTFPDSVPQPSKLVANLPYQIAGPLLARLLEQSPMIQSYTIMVQREVAQRLLAKPHQKDFGPLSLRVEFYCQARLIAKVSPNVFFPPPKVYSALVRLDRRPQPLFTVRDEQGLFAFIRTAFRHRRKTLKNALSDSLGLEKKRAQQILSELNIDPLTRAEALELKDFVMIFEKLTPTL